MTLVYRLTVFLSAFLLFQVQLVIAKYLLPWFGGVPAVFTTCMLFFQAVLLLAYLYADVLSRRLNLRTAARVHTGIVLASVAAVLYRSWAAGSAITPEDAWKTHSGQPLLAILALLLLLAGVPGFVLGSTSPLLQSWHDRSRQPGSAYRLYALSNAGSFLGLLSYPFLVERLLRLQHQAQLWTLLYLLFAAGCVALGWRLSRTSSPAAAAAQSLPASDGAISNAPTDPPPPLRLRAAWFALAACASALLVATTNQICQNVAAVPLLWVAPLAIYLLTFVACFDGDRWYSFPWWSLAFAAGTVLVSYAFRHPQADQRWQILFYLAALFSGCMVCHGEAARLKPHPARLTTFYLCLAAGGAAGGAFVVLVAPLLFKSFFWELHISLWAAWVLLVALRIPDSRSWVRLRNPWMLAVASSVILAGLVGHDSGRRGEVIFYSLAVLVPTAYLFSRRGQRERLQPKDAAIRAGLALLLMAMFLPIFEFSRPLGRARNFYGILAVSETTDQGNPMYQLQNGRTLHGAQYLSPALRDLPTTYYGPRSGVGLALLKHPRRLRGEPLRVGAVGLGAGTIAAYGKAGDTFRFYEINPEDIRFAWSGHPLFFTFLRDSAARVQVVEGDARVRLEEESGDAAPQQFDVLALDAFSGDAIPVHLLTVEAFGIYLRHMRAQDGVLAFHISNRAVDLAPVLAGLARHYGYHMAVVDSGDEERGTLPCRWALITKDPATLSGIVGPKSEFPSSDGVLWTDDFSNLFQVLR